jgi:hypothetical protein
MSIAVKRTAKIAKGSERLDADLFWYCTVGGCDVRDHRYPESGTSKYRKVGAMEQELSVFNRGECPDYEVFGAIIEFFKMYPDSTWALLSIMRSLALSSA